MFESDDISMVFVLKNTRVGVANKQMKKFISMKFNQAK